MLGKTSGIVLCLCAVFVAHAGPLDPPSGPVTDSEQSLGYKTLFQVEPRTPLARADFPVLINTPGSYYLVENVPFTGASGANGIEIIVDDVTIDLNGFYLEGASEVVAGRIGILATNRRNIHIKNGTVRNWSLGGISLPNSENCIIGHMRVENCGFAGIQTGRQSRVHDCAVVGSSDTGIIAFGASINGCTVRDSGGDGIFASDGSTVTNSTSSSNGARGIVVSGGSITSCGSSQNGIWGMQATNGSSISNSGSYQDNSGLDALNGSTITNCAAFDHQNAVGISVRQGSLGESCTVFGGAGDGIQASSGSTVRNCNVSDVGAAGIIVLSSFSRCRIEGNNVEGCATGILVSAGFGNNLIISNSASGNATNYNIAATNAVGQIINVAGATITSGNSWANLSF